MVVQANKQFVMLDRFVAPLCTVDGLQLLEFFLVKSKAAPVHIVIMGGPTDWCLLGLRSPADSVHDPLEHAEILTEARPEEFTVLPFAKPVDVEDSRRRGQRALHFYPVAKIIAHVVATKRKHGHRITPDFADVTVCSSGRF